MGFVHLHTHTEYSLLDGSNKIKEYVARVKELGMTAAAITDHGVMYGVIDFYKACREAGINPIIGCEIYVSPGSRFDKESGGNDDRYYHLVLLCENDTGYQNLMKIVSTGFTEGYYYKPRVDMEILEKYHEGLICLSACLAGEIPRNIVRGLTEEAEKAALRYQNIFGKDNFFLELQDHGIRDQQLVDQTLISMSKKLGIPLVCTNDCHYTFSEDVEPHDILLCLQTGKKLSDTDRMRYEGGQYYVKSEDEMRALFSYIPEAVDNTQRIADRCHVEIKFHDLKLPHFEIPEQFENSYEYLKYLCDNGFKERYPEDDGTLYDRMLYELSVIETMGFVDYFLIVWDYINYSKEHGIPVGPGRGSAAGSIVSYSLKITDIDPVKYDLLFERFLNPERVSMPDIDVDFAFEKRQDVIDYVVQKYGRSKCVQIVTFGTLAAKGVIRDVTRVMDLPYDFGDSLSKMIPNELNITLQKALDENNDLRKLYESDPQVKQVIDMSMRLEGLPRHTSIHAAGILITPEDADRFVPLSRGANGEITTQFTMTTLEELGLLKMDFLGLRTLTVIENAVEFINERTGGNLNINDIDYNDPAILKYIGTGETDGIFQLESGGMQRFMKDLAPESLEDIIAGIALYRP
ncbi:MAG: DNA polymerase III subunit alpha, partial [Lachnospiraceae bacterium]|nr:DNA polymerase III subunit alpha [Lachnospiraceae bacterium]